MPRTYEGVLRQDRVDWTGDRPDPARPVRVRITVLEPTPPSQERGRRMAEALDGLASLGGVSSVVDPRAWQRERRADRALPGR